MFNLSNIFREYHWPYHSDVSDAMDNQEVTMEWMNSLFYCIIITMTIVKNNDRYTWK